jgi:hypothetical protein
MRNASPTVPFHLWHTIVSAMRSASPTTPFHPWLTVRSFPPHCALPCMAVAAINPPMRCHHARVARQIRKSRLPHRALPSMASPRSVPPLQYLPPLRIAVGAILSSKSHSVGRATFFIAFLFSHQLLIIIKPPEVSRINWRKKIDGRKHLVEIGVLLPHFLSLSSLTRTAILPQFLQRTLDVSSEEQVTDSLRLY